MKKLIASALLAFSAFSVIAADNAKTEKSSFDCLDKATLEVNAKCISTKIETSDSFVSNQQAFFEQASEPGEFVMATVLMDPETLNITVIAHREAQEKTLAKLAKLQK